MNFWSLSFVIISLWTSTGRCYQQELILHEKMDLDGNFFTFKSHVSDAKLYSLGDIQLICVRGAWRFYNTTDYTNWHRGFESVGPGLTCSEAASWWSDVQSFRFWAASDTRMDAISLYAEYDLVGQEIFVDEFPVQGISTIVKTLTYTGGSNFTVFEGQNFDGESACLRTPDSIGHYNLIYNITSQLHLSTVGSIVKGCPSNFE